MSHRFGRDVPQFAKPAIGCIVAKLQSKKFKRELIELLLRVGSDVNEPAQARRDIRQFTVGTHAVFILATLVFRHSMDRIFTHKTRFPQPGIPAGGANRFCTFTRKPDSGTKGGATYAIPFSPLDLDGYSRSHGLCAEPPLPK